MSLSPATSPTPSAPVARLSSPGEIAAAVPLLCGFVPHESLVVVSLKGRRSRVGLTMRVDLPPDEHEPALVEQMVERLRFDRARKAVVVVFTEAADSAGGLPRAGLVQALAGQLERAGVRPTDQILVRSGRWWSYACSARCCPPEGTPVEATATPALLLVEAHGVLEGRAVLPSRQDLVASLAAPLDLALRGRLDSASAVRERRSAAEGRVLVGREALRSWRRALEQVLDGHDPLGPQAAATLVVSLSDVLVRDEVLTWAIDDDASLLALLLHLAGRSVPPHDVPVCALVAWVSHLRGDGGLANVALDRALAADPEYGVALLSREALDAQVSPAAVRSLLVDARAVLHQQHPWTASGG